MLFPRLCRVAAVLSLFLIAPGAAAAHADGEVKKDKTLSPYFFVEGGDDPVDKLPLEKTSARIEVSGVVAHVTVTQTYQNRGPGPINAQYVFPASTRAAVHAMRMTIGDRIIEAKVKERGEARRTFEAAKREGKTASLLEQDRPNVFRMNVSNILPNDRIDVELKYTELLVPTDGTYELVYPTVVGPRYSNKSEASADETDAFIKSPYLREGRGPTYAFDLSATLSTGIPLQDLASPSHAIDVGWDGPARARVTLADKDGAGGNRDFILRYRLEGQQVQSGLLLYEGADEKFFLLMVQPPRRVTPAQVPPREYVFIVDVSGSMRGFPLSVSKKLMRDLLGNLRPVDRFNVLLFSGGSRLMSERSLQATPDNLHRAFVLIDKEDGGGGTELLPAMRRALSLPKEEGTSRTFVVITDGYISTEREVFMHVREHLGDANVFCFGIGSSVNRFLVEGIAKAGFGEPFVVTGSSGAAEEARKFADYVRSPVLTRIRVEAKGFELYDVEPASIPDVLADRPVIVHGKWRGERQGALRLTGRSGAGEYASEHLLQASAPLPGANEALKYLWARSRIATLSDFGETESPELASQVTQLGLRYNLLTRFTSFIAVHDVRRTSEAATDVKQPLPLPEGVSESALPQQLEVGDEPGLAWLLCAVAVGLGLWTLARRRRLA